MYVYVCAYFLQPYLDTCVHINIHFVLTISMSHRLIIRSLYYNYVTTSTFLNSFVTSNVAPFVLTTLQTFLMRSSIIGFLNCIFDILYLIHIFKKMKYDVWRNSIQPISNGWNGFKTIHIVTVTLNAHSKCCKMSMAYNAMP